MRLCAPVRVSEGAAHTSMLRPELAPNPDTRRRAAFEDTYGAKRDGQALLKSQRVGFGRSPGSNWSIPVMPGRPNTLDGTIRKIA